MHKRLLIEEIEHCRNCPHYTNAGLGRYGHICTHPDVDKKKFDDWYIYMLNRVVDINMYMFPGCPLPLVTENPDG